MKNESPFCFIKLHNSSLLENRSIIVLVLIDSVHIKNVVPMNNFSFHSNHRRQQTFLQGLSLTNSASLKQNEYKRLDLLKIAI